MKMATKSYTIRMSEDLSRVSRTLYKVLKDKRPDFIRKCLKRHQDTLKTAQFGERNNESGLKDEFQFRVREEYVYIIEGIQQAQKDRRDKAPSINAIISEAVALEVRACAEDYGLNAKLAGQYPNDHDEDE